MKRKVLPILFASILALSTLAGCAKTSNTKTETNTTQESQKDTQKTKDDMNTKDTKANLDTLTITHSKGETTVPLNPKNVAIFDMGILDIVQSLNVNANFAVPQKNLPKYLDSFSSAANIGSVKEPDLEALFAFEPDVIFMSGRLAEYYDQLSEIAPTVYVDLDADTYMEDFKKNTQDVAKLFGKEEDAKKQLDAIDEKVATVKAEAEKSDQTALILLTNDGSISAYGIGSRFGLIHDVLGVKPADSNIEASTHGQEANFEYISSVNPDIIFVVDRTAVVGGDTDAAKTLDNDLVNQTNAAKNNKIIYLSPDYWYLSGGGLTSVSDMISEVEVGIKE